MNIRANGEREVVPAPTTLAIEPTVWGIERGRERGKGRETLTRGRAREATNLAYKRNETPPTLGLA